MEDAAHSGNLSNFPVRLVHQDPRPAAGVRRIDTANPTPQNGSMQKKIERVLIYRLGSLGDMVVALPAFHLIARAFPHAERRMLTNFPVSIKAPAAAAILGGSGLVHGYFRYTVGTRDPWLLLSLWWSLIRWRPQVVVYLGAARGVASARRDQNFFRACGISQQFGIPLTEDMQRNLPQADHDALEPECERLARNVAGLGEAHLDQPAAWDLALTNAEYEKASEVLSPARGRAILAVSVGTKVQAKDWGQANWHELLAHLGALYPDFALALMGVAEEADASEFAAAGWRSSAHASSPVINLCGRLTPRESAACFAQARIFLGHDSGPMHLAATVGTPCVAIFAARNIPRVWFPYGPAHRVIYHAVPCMGCGLETCIVERKKCLTSITVLEVAVEVRAMLG